MDVDDSRILAESLLAGPLPRRWRHVRGVARAAWRLAADSGLDRETLLTAAWLHDIGYAPAIADTGFHPLDGARYLRRLGWPDAVCVLVAHHTGARVEARAHGLDARLDAEFSDTSTPERDALWVADATTGPCGQPMSIDERIVEIAARYGTADPVALAINASRGELRAAAERLARAH